MGTLPDTNTHHAVFNIKALSITVNIGVESPGKKKWMPFIYCLSKERPYLEIALSQKTSFI